MKVPDPASMAQALVQAAGAMQTQGAQLASASNSSPQFQQQLLSLVRLLLKASSTGGSSQRNAGGPGGPGDPSGMGGGGTAGVAGGPNLGQLLNEIAQFMSNRVQPSQGSADDGQTPSQGGGTGGGLKNALQSVVQSLLSQTGASGSAPPPIDASFGSAQATLPAAAAAQPPATAVGPSDGSQPAPSTAPTEGDEVNPPGGSAGLTNNAGGVPQAAAVNGVSPASDKVIDTGSGSDKIENVTNDTNRTESFKYSDRDGHDATMTLAPNETQSFRSGSQEMGVRISPSDASGNTNPNEVLFEDGAALDDPNKQNPDISKVDGDKDHAGNDENMTVTLGDGRTAGDGDTIHAYAFSTDDAASMGLAGDISKTDNVVLSDKTS